MNILLNEEYLTFTLYCVQYKIDGQRENHLIFHKLDDIPVKLKGKEVELKAKFKVPDFDLQCELIKDSTSYRPDGNPYINKNLYKKSVIKNLLKRIELGNFSQDIDENNFSKLDPQIAEHVFFEFDVRYLDPTALTIDDILNNTVE